MTLRSLPVHFGTRLPDVTTLHYLRLTMRRQLVNINRITTELIDADGDRLRVRQNTHPDVQQQKLLSAMGVTLWISQQTGCWLDGIEVIEVVF